MAGDSGNRIGRGETRDYKHGECIECGDARGGEDVQDFAGRLPTDTEVSHHV